MSSINPLWQPMTLTYAVDSSAAVQIPGAGQAGATSFRIRAVTASGYIAWNNKATGFTAAAPTLGAPVANCIGVNLGETVYLELPPNSYFIGNAAFGTGSFEITAGQGGSSSG